MLRQISILGYLICISFIGICNSPNPKLFILYQEVIQKLSSDSMQGREVSSIYEDRSAAIIEERFRFSKIGGVSYQKFTFLNPESNRKQDSKNVYLFVNNHASSTIVIGAHYDHLGLGNSKSLSFNAKGKVHNGADDNASGVALMLGLVSNYFAWYSKKFNYVFVGYSAHEVGLFGSKEFYQMAIKKFGKIDLVLNFDMVGRMDRKQNIVSILGYSSSSFPNLSLSTLNERLKIRTEEYDKILDTDGGIFAKSGIRSLSFTTGLHDDYHKVSDDEMYINYDGIFEIQVLIENLLQQFYSK